MTRLKVLPGRPYSWHKPLGNDDGPHELPGPMVNTWLGNVELPVLGLSNAVSLVPVCLLLA